MKKITLIWIFISLLTFIPLTSINAFAIKNILISDIDDTIKRTGVHSDTLIWNAFGTTNEFAGMSMLYNQWFRDSSIATKIIYLTAAPGFLDGLGLEFLRDSGFPPDQNTIQNYVIGGRNPLFENSGDFKTRKLIDIYNSEQPTTMILIGDNGEQDIEAYSNLMKYVKNHGGKTKIYSFIHHVYESKEKGKEIPEGHTAFLTSADLGVQFTNNGWITTDDLIAILNEIQHDSDSSHQGSHEGNDIDDIAAEIIPPFMECQNFKSWPIYKSTQVNLDRQKIDELYLKVKTNIVNLCKYNN